MGIKTSVNLTQKSPKTHMKVMRSTITHTLQVEINISPFFFFFFFGKRGKEIEKRKPSHLFLRLADLFQRAYSQLLFPGWPLLYWLGLDRQPFALVPLPFMNNNNNSLKHFLLLFIIFFFFYMKCSYYLQIIK